MSRDEAINKLTSATGFTSVRLNDLFDYLDALRLSAVTNMFGAVPYLMQYDSDVTRKTGQLILKGWMDSFGK